MSATAVAARHHPSTGRVRVPYYEPRLGVTIIRGVGWRASCSCGWRGPFRRERYAARLDAHGHPSGEASE